MKEILLLFVLIFPLLGLSQINFSTSITAELGESYSEVKAAYKEYFSIANGEFTLSVKVSNAGVTVQKFDGDGTKEIKRHFYEIEEFPKRTKFVKVIYITDEQFYYIFEAYNKSDDNFSVFYRLINTKDAELGEISKLFTTKQLPTSDPGSSQLAEDGFFQPIGIGLPNFKVNISYDKSKIMISWRNKPTIKKDKNNFDVIGMYVYDKLMNQIWGREIKMPYTEAIMDNVSYGVGNQGHTYIFIRHLVEEKYELLVFNEDELIKYDFDIEDDILFLELQIIENQGGNIICAGYYVNSIDYTQVGLLNIATSFNSKGMYCFTFNRDGELLDQKKTEFPFKFIQLCHEYVIDEDDPVSEVGIQGIKMIDFYFLEDGNYVIIGEEQYVVETTYGSKTSSGEVCFGDIIVAKMSKDGEIIWLKRLPKNQVKQNKITSSENIGTKYFHIKENLYFLFVDNAKNATKKLNQEADKYKAGKSGILTAYKVNDQTGNVDKHLILNTKEIGGTSIYNFHVNRASGVTNDKFLTEVYLGNKKDGMIKISIKNNE